MRKLTKQKSRVKENGEVFTSKHIVKRMLHQPNIREEFESLYSTFLEPSAGDGAFLVELLRKKLQLAEQMSGTKKEYNANVLIGLSTIYGIELCSDNVESLLMNMYATFSKIYNEVIYKKFSERPSRNVLKSAHTIIKANFVQGNTLTFLNSHNKPIIFSQWKISRTKKGNVYVDRTESTFRSMVDENQNESVIPQAKYKEFDLFKGNFEDPTDGFVKYKRVIITNVFKELME